MEAHPLPSAYAKYTVSKRFQTPMAEILHEVQLHHVFPDSKEFVDMPMRKDPQEICDSWRELLSQEDSLILNKEVLLKFVEEHFAPPGSDMVWNSKQLSWPHTTNLTGTLQYLRRLYNDAQISTENCWSHVSNLGSNIEWSVANLRTKNGWGSGKASREVTVHN